MKKILTITFSVILSIILLNVILYYIIIFSYKFNPRDYRIFHRENFAIETFMNSYEFREPSGLEYKKKPSVIIFGCGITNVYTAKDEETINYHLSKYTKRPVYNRAVGGGGIQHAIIQVQSEELDDIIKNSSHAFYIISAMNDNLRLRVTPGPFSEAVYALDNQLFPRFVYNKDKELVLYKSKCPIIKGNILYRLINKIIATGLYTDKIKSFNLYKKNVEFTKDHIIKLNDELKKVNPDIKFSVLFYYENENNKDIKGIEKELKEKGIDFIFLSSFSPKIDLVNDTKYRNMKTLTPKAAAWEDLSPLIAKKLGL